MNTIQTVYRFDSNGYYIGECSAMNDAEGNLLLPGDCTTTKPTNKEGYWYKINATKTKWSAEKIPTSFEEIKDLKIAHDDNTPRAIYLKNLMQSVSDENYTLKRDDDLAYYFEAIPEKTELEIKKEQEQQEQQESQATLQELLDSMTLAQLANDQEQIALLQAMYQEYLSAMEG